MIAAHRIARRLVRKLMKPLRLRLNAYRYEQSEQEIAHLENLRVAAIERLQAEHLHQVELQMQRNQIAGW